MLHKVLMHLSMHLHSIYIPEFFWLCSSFQRCACSNSVSAKTLQKKTTRPFARLWLFSLVSKTENFNIEVALSSYCITVRNSTHCSCFVLCCSLKSTVLCLHRFAVVHKSTLVFSAESFTRQNVLELALRMLHSN